MRITSRGGSAAGEVPQQGGKRRLRREKWSSGVVGRQTASDSLLGRQPGLRTLLAASAGRPTATMTKWPSL
jgi:hypothetical protein